MRPSSHPNPALAASVAEDVACGSTWPHQTPSLARMNWIGSRRCSPRAGAEQPPSALCSPGEGWRRETDCICSRREISQTGPFRYAAPAIVWLRQDLRLADNPALQAACRRGGPVVPVFIWAPEEEGAWPPGGASRWWLHQSLARLAAEFHAAGAELVIRRGSSLAELLSVAKATGADAVFWNRRYEPAIIARDRKVEEALRAAGLQPRASTARCCTSPGPSRTRPAGPSRSSRRSGEPAWPPPNRPSRCPRPADSPRRPGSPRRCRSPRWNWSRRSTGPPACAPPGSPAAPAPRPSCSASCATAS